MLVVENLSILLADLKEEESKDEGRFFSSADAKRAGEGLRHRHAMARRVVNFILKCCWGEIKLSFQ